MAKVIVDTGILYAMADEDDAWHERIRRHLEVHREELIVPVTVLPEACYLMNQHLGAEAERRFIEGLAQGEMKLESILPADLPRVSVLLVDYGDANIGFVDATVVAVAERLRVRRVLTTDRRHFAAIRPSPWPSFDLLP